MQPCCAGIVDGEITEVSVIDAYDSCPCEDGSPYFFFRLCLDKRREAEAFGRPDEPCKLFIRQDRNDEEDGRGAQELGFVDLDFGYDEVFPKDRNLHCAEIFFR